MYDVYRAEDLMDQTDLWITLLNKTKPNMKKYTHEQKKEIKKVFQLMLNNQHLFDLGLCAWLCELLTRSIITNKQCYFVLKEYIEHNRVSKFSSFEAFINRNSGFWWEIGNIKPRIKWLKQQIKKLES